LSFHDVSFSAFAASNKQREAYVFGSFLCLSVRPSVRCPLTFITISSYLVEKFQWNLQQMFITWVGVAV